MKRKYVVIFFIFIIAMIFFVYSYKNFFYLLKLSKKEKTLISQLKAEKALITDQVYLQKQLNMVKKKIAPYFKVNSPLGVTEVLNAIFQAGEKTNVEIQEAQPNGSWKNSDVYTFSIRLVAKGSFLQFLEFFDVLSKNTPPLVLTDFNFTVVENGSLNITAKMVYHFFSVLEKAVAKPSVEASLSESVLPVHDPFVNSLGYLNGGHDPMLERQVQLSSVSIAKIKFVGYLRDGNQIFVFAMLPNGKTFDLSQGSIIGVEKAIVSQISEKEMMFQISGKIVKKSYSL